MPDNRGNVQSADKGLLPAYESGLKDRQVFKLHAPYSPTSDQPQAIEALVKGFKEGNQLQTLLGVTGSGKTFMMPISLRIIRRSLASFTESLRNFSLKTR